MTALRSANSPRDSSSRGFWIDWPIVLFFVMAYTVAWVAFGLLGQIAIASGLEDAQALLVMGEAFQFEGVSLIVPGWIVYLLTRVADFAFSLAGLVMIWVTAGREGLRILWQRLIRFQIGPTWLLLGLAPVVVYGIAAAAAGGIWSADFGPSTIIRALFSLEAGFFVSLFLRGAMGEELGLRGFALPRLQEYMSPFRVSIIIGVLWFGWHLPVLIGRDPVTLFAFAILTLGLSMIFTLLFNGSGGSLVPVLLFHAAQNWEEGFEVIFPALAGTEWEIVSTLTWLILGLLAGGLVTLLDKRFALQNAISRP